MTFDIKRLETQEELEKYKKHYEQMVAKKSNGKFRLDICDQYLLESEVYVLTNKKQDFLGGLIIHKGTRPRWAYGLPERLGPERLVKRMSDKSFEVSCLWKSPQISSKGLLIFRYWLSIIKIISSSFNKQRKLFIAGSFVNGMSSYYLVPGTKIIYSGPSVINNHHQNVRIFCCPKYSLVLCFLNGVYCRYFKRKFRVSTSLSFKSILRSKSKI